MKWSIVGIITIGIIALLFFIVRGNSYDIVNYPSSGTEIIAFGDSLVQGVGSTEGNDFVSVLSRKLGIPIRNEGVSGDTTRDARLRLDKAIGEDPEVVLVLLGGNDYLQRIPKEETFNNLGVITDEIQRRGGVVMILGIRGGVLTDSYEKDFEKFTRTHGAAYVSNVLENLIGHPKYMDDSVHPNDAGYMMIAERVAPILSKVVN